MKCAQQLNTLGFQPETCPQMVPAYSTTILQLLEMRAPRRFQPAISRRNVLNQRPATGCRLAWKEVCLWCKSVISRFEPSSMRVSSCNRSFSAVPRKPWRDSRLLDGSEKIWAFLSQWARQRCEALRKLQKGMHAPQLARALPLEGFWNAVSLILEQGTTHTCPAQLVIFAALACIRCKHFVKTGLHEITKDTIYVFRSEGKSRRQGNRRPYSWAVPRPTFLGSAPSQFLLGVNQKLGQPSFFLVAACTSRHRQFAARWWRASPMLHSQWVRLVRQALADSGRPLDTPEKYTFKHFETFPTNSCKCHRVQRQDCASRELAGCPPR